MRNVKYAIDGIVRKPIMLFAIVVQILIGTMILFEGISISLKTIDTINRTKGMFADKKVYRLINDTNIENEINLNKEDDFNNRAYEMYKKLKNSNDFSVCLSQFSNILIKDFCEDDKFYYMPDKEKKYDINPYQNVNGKFSDLKGYYIDEGYAEEFPFELSEGRNFTKEDFDLEDNIPVILGAEYKGIYNIGDRFKYFDYRNLVEKNIEVVGIAKENSYFFHSGDITTLDDRVICPTENFKLDDKLSNKFNNFISGSLVVTNNKDKALKELRGISSSLGLYTLNLRSCDSDIQFLIESLSKDCKDSILLSLTIFLFVSIGIITVQLNNIKERLKEFGIHLLIGSNKKDIALRNFYTVAIYLGLGMILGSYFEYLSNKNLYDFFTWDIRGVFIILVIYLILLFIISYFPYRKIRKLEVNNIIRGLNE